MHQTQPSSSSRSAFNDSLNDPTLPSSSSKDQGTPVNSENVVRLYRGLKPITQSYRDAQGRQVQLWKSPQHGLIGSVVDLEGRLSIIPGEKIQNPLNANESPEAILQRLKNCGLKNWDIAFDAHTSMLTLWPHLQAAADDDEYVPNHRDKLAQPGELYSPDNYEFEERHGYGGKQRIKPGRGGENIRVKSEKELIEFIEKKGYVAQPKLGKDWWKHPRTKHEVWINREKKYIQVRRSDAQHARAMDQLNQGLMYGRIKAEGFIQRNGFNSAYQGQALPNEAQKYLNTLRSRVRNKEITEENAYKDFSDFLSDKNREFERRRIDYGYARFPTAWRLDYGRPPRDPGRGPLALPRPLDAKNEQKTAFGGKDPTKKSFEQNLQQTRLTESYNATHRNNPVPAKGTGGVIGGVACGTDYIEGLLDSLFENEHYFCLPKLAGGKAPFSNEELRTILRELAIGVYVHGTIPFFSLHFNQNADLFPVIHPAYENTLVGRVISMLDYIMKGYLNGGVFEDDFINEWYRNPNWKEKSTTAFEKLIDFFTYCLKKLQGEDKNYSSLNALINTHKEEKKLLSSLLSAFLGEKEEEDEDLLPSDYNLLAPEDRAKIDHMNAVLKNHTGFKNSFRIIAKQNSIQKEGPVFVIDSDFDVLYTINPSPVYQEALDQYVRIHGFHPPRYQRMCESYELMCQKIHDHMVKMPLCRDLFAMLSVINFFSGYFSTLKKHRKIPILPAFKTDTNKGSPALFPHLPIQSIREAKLQVNYGQVFTSILQNHSAKVEKHLTQLFTHIKFSSNATAEGFVSPENQPLLDIFSAEVRNNMMKLGDPPLRRFLQSQPFPQVELFAKELFNQMNKTASSYFSEVKRLSKDPDPQESAHQCLKRLVFKDKAIDLAEMSYNSPRVKPELSFQEVEDGMRIVGGCGMQLQIQSVQHSKQAADIFRNNWSKMRALPSEEWMEVKGADDFNGTVFRLPFEQIPAWENDNFEWMGSQLLVRSGENSESIKARLKIQKAMAKGKKDKFIQLINQNPQLKEMKDRDGRTLLHHAAMLQDPFYSKSLLGKGLSPENEDVHGCRPIHYAAMQGVTEQLPLLGRTVNSTSHNGSTPLVVAIQHHQPAMVRALIKGGAIISSLAEGYNTLHCALHQGNLEIINIVLDSPGLVTKTMINECSEEGGTPLMLACELDSKELVEKLIKRGADPKAMRKDGMTASEIAVIRNCKPVLECLLKHAEPSRHCLGTVFKQGSVEVLELLKKFAYFYTTTYKENGLHIAIRNGNIPVALSLIRGCQELKFLIAKNLAKETPFTLAATLGIWEVVEALYNKGVPTSLNPLLRGRYHPIVKKIFNSRENYSDGELRDYLLVAAQAGNYDAITEVLSDAVTKVVGPRGEKLDDLKGKNGWNLLHYLAKCDGFSLFRRLIVAKANDLMQPLKRPLYSLQPLKNEEGKTLAYIAAENGSSHVLRFLLEQIKKKNISLEKHFQNRHLFYAVLEAGRVEHMQWMLDIFGDNLATQDLDGNGTRPVHVAAQKGSKAMLELLSQRGADLSVTDKDGYAPLDYALRCSAEEAVNYLRSKGLNPALINANNNANRMPAKNDERQKNIVELVEALGDEAFQESRLMELFNKLPVDETILLELQNERMRGTPIQLILRLADKSTKLNRFLKDIIKRVKLNPNIRDSDGNTLVHLLFKANLSPKVLDELLDAIKDRSDINAVNANGRTPLFYAIEAKNYAQVRSFIERGADLNHYDHKLITPLMLACSLNQLHTVQSLIVNGADPNQVGEIEKIPPLNFAICACNDEVIHLLLSLGVNCNQASGDGTHPVHLAAKMGKVWLLRLFAAMGLPLDIKNREGMQPIHFATSNGEKEALSALLLLQGESVVNAQVEGKGSEMLQGTTPVQFVAQCGQPDMLEALLLNPNVKPEIPSKDGTGILSFAALNAAPRAVLEQLHPYDFSSKKDQLFSAFTHAIVADNIESVKTLHKWGVTVNADLNGHGHTGLHLACQYGALQCTQWLLENGADYTYANPFGQNALEISAANKSHEQFKLLLEYTLTDWDQDIDQINSRGETLMHIAARAGNLNHVMILLMNFASISKADFNGFTALHFAVKGGHAKVVSLLMACGADFSARSASGKLPINLAEDEETRKVMVKFKRILDEGSIKLESPLHLAIKSGDNLAFFYLVDLHDVNEKDSDGITPLHLAAQLGNIEFVMALLERDADIDAEDNSGRTPLAYVKDNPEVADFLVREGAKPL